MNIYEKLNAARVKFHELELKKSGQNTYAGYAYFELGDFVVEATRIFAELGLCEVTYFTDTEAVMEINDTSGKSAIVFKSPLGGASLKGCHEVQNIGAVQTYQRRYLWTMALQIVEHDALDAQTGNKQPGNAEPIDDAQFAELGTLAEQSGADMEKFCKAYKIEAMKFLPADKFGHAKAALLRKLNANQKEAA